MKVEYGKGKTEYGPGVQINLSGNEVACAIDAYLVAHNIHVSGSRTITMNDKLLDITTVYVDPEGFVVTNGKKLSGRGKSKNN